MRDGINYIKYLENLVSLLLNRLPEHEAELKDDDGTTYSIYNIRECIAKQRQARLRKIEVYYLRTDHTWNTGFVEIPADTPEQKIAEVAIETARKQASDNWVDVGIYHIPDIEDPNIMFQEITPE